MIRKILERTRNARKKFSDYPRSPAKLSREQRRELRAELDKTYNEANSAAKVLLSDSQMARFNQIRIWIARERSLFSDDVITDLKLSNAQKNALTGIWEKLGKKMLEIPEIPKSADGTKAEKQRKMQDQVAILEREAGTEYLGVLTTEQREQFDRMRGSKFEVEMSEFPMISGDRAGDQG